MIYRYYRCIDEKETKSVEMDRALNSMGIPGAKGTMTMYNSARRMEKERERGAALRPIDGRFTYVVDCCAILRCAAIALV